MSIGHDACIQNWMITQMDVCLNRPAFFKVNKCFTYLVPARQRHVSQIQLVITLNLSVGIIYLRSCPCERNGK